MKALFSRESQRNIALALYTGGLTKLQASRIANISTDTMQIMTEGYDTTRFKSVWFDMSNDYIVSRLKQVVLLDIETTPVSVHTFSIGRGSQVSYGSLHNQQEIKMLSVCSITLYDAITKGMKSMTCLKCDITDTGVDDTQLCADLAEHLDGVKTLIAHNGSFDQNWIAGRMLRQGVKYTPLIVADTVNMFRGFNLLCKKLDYLMGLFFGLKKLPTAMSDWATIVEPSFPMKERQHALDYMCEYNAVDVALMFPLYFGFAKYNPLAMPDFNNPDDYVAQCRVDGSTLLSNGTWTNPVTGLTHNKYFNPRLGITYRTRVNVHSKRIVECRLVQHGKTIVHYKEA